MVLMLPAAMAKAFEWQALILAIAFGCQTQWLLWLLAVMQTDALIQRTIRRVFAERATLTIAHRLDTIIFSDKIMAMAQGQVGAWVSRTGLVSTV